jgi:hypothetical protein
VRHAPGLEDQIPWSGYAYFLTYLDADLSLQHVGVLVLVAVSVHGRGECTRPDRMLDEREVTLGLLSPIMNLMPSFRSHTVSPSSGESTMRACVFTASLTNDLLS